ncbi:TRAP transporter small permease subunit [Thioclava indica]|uniref:TRAP transporter small permease protein n=1 Tax=Thioclava indica TaxID=1353528 RepID=A0A074JWA7_9RHOB|nr:TRAP transporter small permease subunit [Thioclava indica]KEO60769.1 hypothetical protein DT23_12450 [Thioclava indica]
MSDGFVEKFARVLDRVAEIIASIGKLSCWLLIPIILSVLLSILGGVFRVTQFLDWEGSIPLFGSGLTLNSVLELQWYLFGVLLMLTGSFALHSDRHVRVDVVSSRFSPRFALIVEILGDLFFLLPLCVILIDRSWPLLEMAYRTGEQSNEDGLTHRWLIKMFVPIGFTLLASLGVTRILRNLLTLMGAPAPKSPAGDNHGS